MLHHDFIAILDFGAQYNQLIARRVRESNIYCEILPYDTSLSELKKKNTKGVIFTGGPNSVFEKDAPQPDPKLLTSGIPILGICYGMQLLAHALKGHVGGTTREYGRTELLIEKKEALFAGLNDSEICWMSHGDSVLSLPEGFETLAKTATGATAAIGNHEKKIYGVQFHPEVTHTEHGKEIIKNFLYAVCQAKPTWTTQSFIEEAVENIRRQVGQKRILCALSGGVDSTTVAALVHKAVGDQLTCMFIDQGFMRKNEAKKINK